MKKNVTRIMALIVAITMMFSVSAFAEIRDISESRGVFPTPSIKLVGNTANCSVKLSYFGKSISATLELKQGSTVIASWSGTKSNALTLSGNAVVQSGLTYTLTVSGTVNGVAYTPSSISITP